MQLDLLGLTIALDGVTVAQFHGREGTDGSTGNPIPSRNELRHLLFVIFSGTSDGVYANLPPGASSDRGSSNYDVRHTFSDAVFV